MRRPILYLILAIVFGAAVVVGNRLLTSDDERAARQAGPSPVGGPFALTDPAGKQRKSGEFRGRYMLIFFGYTHCPDICPATLQTVSDAMGKLKSGADRVQPIFIAVDPARDTPKRLALFSKAFDERMLMLTGDVVDIRKVAKSFNAYFRYGEKDKDGNYTVSHTATLYLMGPDGRYRDHFNADMTVEKLAAALARHLGGGG